MPIIIKKTERKDITKIVCPECGERLRGIGLFKESHVVGLGFKCKRCHAAWEVTTE
jgi:transposase-like protein